MEKSKTGASWPTFILIFIMGAVFALSFFKVPGAMLTLAAEFCDGDMTVAAWFMSICSVAGTIIAFFTGAIQKSIGPKSMLIIALICALLDSVLGLVAGAMGSVEVFMVSRFCCGLGNGFLATAGPTLITLLFKDPGQRALPNSIWSCWTAVGSLIMLNLFAVICKLTGTEWEGAWWVNVVVGVIALIVAIAFIKIDPVEAKALVNEGENIKPWSGLTMLNTWLLVIIFACFAFIFSCWSAMAPTYMQLSAGMDMAAANSVSSITTITGIVGALIIGAILRKAKNQPAVMVVIMILTTIVGICEFVFTGQAMMVVMAVLCGVIVNAVPPAIFQNAQWGAKNPAGIAMIMAALPIGSNLGGIPASPAVSACIVPGAAWTGAAIILGVVGVIGVICSIIFMARCGKYSKAAMSGQAQDTIEE